MNIPELLAPVGSQEALVAAVQNGADAVYLGGKMFSARQYAANFDRDELRQAVEYAHIRGVKVYITVNTLLADAELAEALDYLRFLHQIGADAIIVQDFGLAAAAHQLLPSLPLHASTQMTVHNSGGVETLKEQGFSRVVLARELSLQEIKEIGRKTGVELEVFVHGALCVSYSGQCLMSSMIGGRSGNRGRCAQPCRMEYMFVDEKGNLLADPDRTGRHLLSPRDLNMIGYIPELAESGVRSLKIEGRMKRPEYVATVTRIYRAALDRYRMAPQEYAVEKQDIKELSQIFNRGFTTGYFFDRQGKDMMSFKRPNNRGLRLGRVTGSDWSKRLVEIQLEDTLRIGDGIEFWVTEGGRKGVIVSRILVNGNSVEEAGPGDKVWINAEGRIRSGDRVFKTHDAELMSRAEQSYRSPREIKKIPLHFRVRAVIGQPLQVTVTDPEGRVSEAHSDFLGQEAKTKPLTRESLENQINRLGNTPFAIGKLEAAIDANVMVPASAINETRRKAIDGLVEQRAKVNTDVQSQKEFTEEVCQLLGHDMRKAGLTEREESATRSQNLKLTARVWQMDTLKAAVENGINIIYFGGSNLCRGESEVTGELTEALDLCRKYAAELVISTPRVVRDKEMKRVMTVLSFARANSLPVMTANLGTLRKALVYGITDVYSDFSFNIFNTQTLRLLVNKYHIKQATISPELTLGEITGLASKAEVPLEALVEGHLPLMITEYCPTGCIQGNLAVGSKCGAPCRSGSLKGLKDRMGLVFPITHDEFCRTHLYNAKELSLIEDIKPLAKAGISRFRIEFSVEEPSRAAQIARHWRTELDRYRSNPAGYQPNPEAKEKINAMSPAGLTKGHYYRGVE